MRVILFTSDSRVVDHDLPEPLPHRCDYGGETFMHSGKDQNGTPVYIPLADSSTNDEEPRPATP